MARLRKNAITDAARGRIGDLVVKQYKYGTVLSRMPCMDEVVRSEKQIRRQDRWTAAAAYHRTVKANPELFARYQKEARKRGHPVSAVTNRDFSRPPFIQRIDLGGYCGTPGSTIIVAAFDDFQVAAVNITVRDAGGQVLEAGAAVYADAEWTYRATVSVPLLQVHTIEAVAVDLPGNRVSASVTWMSPFKPCVPSTGVAPAQNAPIPPPAAVAPEPPIDYRAG
jgi:hypothetical protein